MKILKYVFSIIVIALIVYAVYLAYKENERNNEISIDGSFQKI